MDESEDILVRHESAEALGAIGDINYLSIVQQFCNHCNPDISETCQIAVDLLLWKKDNNNIQKSNLGTSGIYLSHDPAPPFEISNNNNNNNNNTEIMKLRTTLLDNKQSLFHRYRAMFSLRNYNNDLAACAIADGFSDNSALFRHEIAYVLGQMQRKVTVPQLTLVLRNNIEHKMVRHEAAEALGAIGGPDVEIILKEYENDNETVVKESVLVALDTMDYWTNFNEQI